MGLGKTLTMIALVATDVESSGDVADADEGCHLDVPATLIVVPPPCKMLNVFSSTVVKLTSCSDGNMGRATYRVRLYVDSEAPS